LGVPVTRAVPCGRATVTGRPVDRAAPCGRATVTGKRVAVLQGNSADPGPSMVVDQR